MPLSKGKSKAAFGHNVAAEVHAGKPIKQAVAIAYSEKRKHMADGGEIEQSDDDAVMDHMALECMHAIERKDTQAFMDALHVLVGDLLTKMQEPMEGDDDAS